jgi:TIGR03009 family protein
VVGIGSRLRMVCGLLLLAGGFALADDGKLLENRVDTVLREWSEKTGQIRSLYTVFTRTIVDPVWNGKDVSPGSARYLSPKMARLDVTGGQMPESLVLPGNGEAWHYKPANQNAQDNIVEIHKLPQDVQEKDVLEDGPLPFLFATKPEKAKQRYKFEILEEDEQILRAKITPKLEDDQRDFVEAEITLKKTDWLPTRISILEATKQQVTYDLSQTWTNIEISPSDFAVSVPKGWKSIRMQAVMPAGAAGEPNAQEVPRLGFKQ